MVLIYMYAGILASFTVHVHEKVHVHTSFTLAVRINVYF